jgi:hypothetical protein
VNPHRSAHTPRDATDPWRFFVRVTDDPPRTPSIDLGVCGGLDVVYAAGEWT